MKKQILINQITKGEFVAMKVTVHPNIKTMLEITDSTGNLIEEFGAEKTFNETIEYFQLKMLRKAGEYQNKGMHTVINPFTN